MGLFNFKSNKKKRSFQTKNEAVFVVLTKHGFSAPDIRKAMMVLNHIKLSDIADHVGIAAASNTIAGRRTSRTVMTGLATRLEIPVDILFPNDEEV